MTGLLQIWKQCICFSGHAYISDNRTHYGNAQKQDKIFCRDQNDDLTDILKKFKDSDLNEFIEAKVHKELEGIRINGAVVGLAAGAALYGLIEYLYLPIISLLFSL